LNEFRRPQTAGFPRIRDGGFRAERNMTRP
jgi:hypothetical protein